AAQWCACFGQMDPHLMGPPGLQAALNKCVSAQFLDDTNVSYSTFADTTLRGAAPPSITPVADKMRLNPAIARTTADDGQVAALDGMFAELAAKVPGCIRRAGEDDEAARFFVDTMNGPQARSLACATDSVAGSLACAADSGSFFLRQRGGEQVGQSGRKKST